MIYLKLIYTLLLLHLTFDSITCDLSLFPNEMEPSFNPNMNGGLSLFSTENTECPEAPKCEHDDDYSQIDKEVFCDDHCQAKISQLLEKNTFKCYQEDRKQDKQNETTKKVVADSSQQKFIDSEGFLFYYRQFVHNLLEEINFKDLSGETSSFHINLFLTTHQLNKLNQFSASQDTSKANNIIQEATDILNNMFSHVHYFEPEEFAESMSKAILSIALDPRVQISLCLVIVVVIMFSILGRQICRHGFSVKSLVVTLLVFVFIISVVNNHFLITQKNQIFKNQKLKEKIPEECFGSNFPFEKEVKNTNIFVSTMSHITGYFKVKPSSQVCLEFQEALLLDAKQANFIETIIYTITESVRPISILFGESINLFYSSLTKNLSFYQYVPLMAVVTIVMVPLLFYVISLFSLVFFGYEFNFFHLISFKKSSHQPNAESLAQQSELLKILAVLKKENEIIAQGMLQSRIDQNGCVVGKDQVKYITTNLKEMTISGASDIVDSIYTKSQTEVKKPDSYYNEPEEEKVSIDSSLIKPAETSLNESICEEVVKYVNNSSTKTMKLLERNELLEFENLKLKEMIFYQRGNDQESIMGCSGLDLDLDDDKENCSGVLVNNVGYSNHVSIGHSKSINRQQQRQRQNNSMRSLKNSYVKDISDTDFGDDDEDILVILDEK